ncbi:MAG: PEP-CTERM sorting domain-containing protein [Planctomycetaceae bacterium]|nr:PEP-CTERM sorting domain-containing protein [Planctomycetaceae bacterium]
MAYWDNPADLDLGRVILNYVAQKVVDETNGNGSANSWDVSCGPGLSRITTLGGTGNHIATVTFRTTSTGLLSSSGTLYGTGSGGAGVDTSTDLTFTVGGTVVTPRLVTADPITLGRFMSSQAVGGSTILSTASGDDNNATRIQVNGTAFNANSVTSTYNLAAATYAPGSVSGTLHLPVTTLENGGAGLTGEGNYADVVVAYSGASLTKRSFTDPQTADLGNVLLGADKKVDRLMTFSTSGTHDTTTDVTFINSLLTDPHGVTLSPDASIFDGSNDVGSRTLGGTFRATTYGQVTSGLALTSTGENLNGEGTYAVHFNYTANVGLATAGIGGFVDANKLTGEVSAHHDFASLPVSSKTQSSQGGGVLGTEAVLIDGSLASNATIVEQWRTRTIAEKAISGGGLISDILDLSGLPKYGDGSTDAFVIQMSYDPGQLSGIWGLTESDAVAQKRLYLAYLSPGADGIPNTSDDLWTPAVSGNIGGTPNFIGDHAYDPAYFELGNYGVDTANHVVWAVVNHNSSLAAVPEPTVLSLLAVALLGAAMIFVRRR